MTRALEPVREVPIMWPDDDGQWKVRILLDFGVESNHLAGGRYWWKGGGRVKEDELDEVAELLEEATT